MEIYNSLIGLGINIFAGNNIINTYCITKIIPTGKSTKTRGPLFECHIDYQNEKIIDPYMKKLDFDERTLNELLINGESLHPLVQGVKFKVI